MLSSTTSLWQLLYRNDLAVAAAGLARALPVCFIHGSKDNSAPIEAARALLSMQAEWKFHTLPNVNHHPWLRDPRRCSESIAQWLEATLRPTPAR